ncbi:MAG TPA: ATP-binding protein [Patescibacteria group bacterium]|nr:ATP-binding protein [Patescibacteria group bacterium]
MTTKQMEGKASNANQWVVIWFAIIVAGMASLFVVTSGLAAHIFNLRFSPYALLSLTSVVSNTVILVFIARIKTRSDNLSWFATHVSFLLAWALIEAIIRMSTNLESALFWWPLSSLVTAFVPFTFYMFILTYVSPKKNHIWTMAPLLATTVLLVFLDLRTSFFNQYTLSKVVPTAWGGGLVPPGHYYMLMNLWVFGLYILAIVMLVRFYRRTLDPRLKRQARLFIFASGVPITLGFFTDGLMPAIGAFSIVPLAVPLTAAGIAVIAYGIKRYRFLDLTPALIAINILDTINEAVIEIADDLKIGYANDGAKRMLGYTPQQLGTMHFPQFLSQNWDASALQKTLSAPSTHDHVSEFDSVDVRTASGGMLTTKMSVSQIIEDGTRQGYLVVITDISKIAHAAEIIEQQVQERTREVQEAKTTLITSLNSLKQGFVIIDAKFNVIQVNAEAHELFCGDTSHLASNCTNVSLAKIQALFGPKQSLSDDIKQCLHRQFPQEIKDINFNNRNWQVYLSPMVVDRQSIGCAILIQDTTEERILERSRDEFFSIASHELRTPLTSIKGNSSLIMEYYEDALKDPSLKEMVSDIHESSGRLIEIVNDFLDASRLEQGRLSYHLESLMLSEVIETATYELSRLAAQKNIQLHVAHELLAKDLLPPILADKNRLKQIIFNLLGNAIKFTEKGTISITAVPSNDMLNMLNITITDTGSGIAPESQSLLFHKFQQASNSILTRDTTRGTGLGLYISRLLAEAMGGKLVLTSSVPGEGSVFTLTLPIATLDRLKRIQQDSQVVDTQSGLIVDAP